MNTNVTNLLEPQSKLRIGFIGAGNMAQAILKGLIQAGIAEHRLSCSNPSPEKLDLLTSEFPALSVSQNNLAVAKESDIIIIAVKPQKLSEVLKPLSAVLLADKLIISVVAGVETESFCKQLQQNISIIRAMPNTPATIGMGATGLFANSMIEAQHKNHAESIFNAVGLSVWIEQEAQMDLVTAISGSGPAHYFLYLESMIKSATNQGMSPEVAKTLVTQTALGAINIVSQDLEQDISQLRRKVTSPAGTTAAAIDFLQQNNFESLIDKAVQSSVTRGKELAKTVEKETKNKTV